MLHVLEVCRCIIYQMAWCIYFFLLFLLCSSHTWKYLIYLYHIVTYIHKACHISITTYGRRGYVKQYKHITVVVLACTAFGRGCYPHWLAPPRLGFSSDDLVHFFSESRSYIRKERRNPYGFAWLWPFTWLSAFQYRCSPLVTP